MEHSKATAHPVVKKYFMSKISLVDFVLTRWHDMILLSTVSLKSSYPDVHMYTSIIKIKH